MESRHFVLLLLIILVVGLCHARYENGMINIAVMNLYVPPSWKASFLILGEDR
jgi:hypothetical protein